MLASRPAVPHPLGLQNQGNTCFGNALLQCLLQTHPLTAYLLSGVHGYSCTKPDPKAFCLLCEMEGLVQAAAQAAPGSTLAPRILSAKNVRKIAPTLTPGRQVRLQMRLLSCSQ